ncbi:hypothetical protein D3C79_1111810 [compost metagenome]
MEDVFAVFAHQRPNRQLLDIDVGAHQRCQLRRQFADEGRLYAVMVNKAGHFRRAI